MNIIGPAVECVHKYSMRILVLRDYPDNLSEVIHRNLYTEYTITGYYGDSGLEWVLEYRGSRDTVLLELALSEYILDAATVSTWNDYCSVYRDRVNN